MPLISRAAAANVRLLNPDFEYLFFDEMRICNFMNAHFPEYKKVFNSFRFPIQKWDFFRYLAVYHFGGFYFDLDFLLYEPLSDLLTNSCAFTFERIGISRYLREEYDMHWEIGNYAFGAAPGHPFVRAVIENCVKAQAHPEWADIMLESIPWLFRKNAYVICTTGPGLVSRTYAENPALQSTVNVLFPDNIFDRKNWNQFGTYGVHLMDGSWRKRGNKLHRAILNYCFSRTENRNIRIGQMRNSSGQVIH